MDIVKESPGFDFNKKLSKMLAWTVKITKTIYWEKIDHCIRIDHHPDHWDRHD